MVLIGSYKVQHTSLAYNSGIIIVVVVIIKEQIFLIYPPFYKT